MENFRLNEPIKSGEIAWSATFNFAVTGAVVSVLNALGLNTFITTAALRTRKHVMIINLIVTDLLFGAAGMSSTVYYLLKPSDTVFYVVLILNIFPKAASFFTLGVIAVERMHAIVWPIRHQVLGNSVYRAALVSVWVLAAVVTTFETLVLAVNEEKISMHVFGVFETVLFFGIVTSIAACYKCIWFSVRRRKRRKLGAPDDQDKALALTPFVNRRDFSGHMGHSHALYVHISNVQRLPPGIIYRVDLAASDICSTVRDKPSYLLLPAACV